MKTTTQERIDRMERMLKNTKQLSMKEKIQKSIDLLKQNPALKCQ